MVQACRNFVKAFKSFGCAEVVAHHVVCVVIAVVFSQAPPQPWYEADPEADTAEPEAPEAQAGLLH